MGRNNRNDSSANNDEISIRDLVYTALEMSRDFVRIADKSNQKEREYVRALTQNHIPSLEYCMRANPKDINPKGAVAALQLVCRFVIDGLDGSTSKERELLQRAWTLADLLEELPSSITWV